MHETPNPLPAGVSQSPTEAIPSKRPTSSAHAEPETSGGAASGTSSASGTGVGGEIITISRPLRVQLEMLSDADWWALRRLGNEAARYGNAKLAQLYCEALGASFPESAERRASGALSGDVYVSVGREVYGVWRRLGKKILSGEQSLAQCQATRALVCRGEHMSVAHRPGCDQRGARRKRTCDCPQRRHRHALVIRTGDRYALHIRLAKASACLERQTFGIHWKPQADEYTAPVLERLADGSTRLLKVTFLFERPGRKVFALLTYEKHVLVPIPGTGVATLGPLEPEDGTLWMRWEDPATQRRRLANYTHRVHRLVKMKMDFAGIHRRLRERTRRTGPKHLQRYRDALLKAGHFGAWAHGFLHQWSAEIVLALTKAGIGRLAMAPLEYHGLPMHALVQMLTDKCAQLGISVERIDPTEPSGERALERPVAHQRKRVKQAEQEFRALRQIVKHRKTG